MARLRRGVECQRIVACWLLCLVLFWLAGCSTHNMWNVSERVDAKPLTNAHYSPHTNRVFLTEGALPKSATFAEVAQIDVGTVTTETTEKVLVMMADKARELGANAVIRLHIWRQGSGFSWKAPQGAGMAVFVTDTNSLLRLNGYWY